MPSICPKCDSGDIEGHEDDEEYGRWDATTKRFISDVIRLPVSCVNCGFRWIEVYTLNSWHSAHKRKPRHK